MDPVILLVVLACPIGMGLMMWLMNKNMSGQKSHLMSNDQLPTNTAKRLAELQEQRQILEAEIAEASRIAELEAQREALRTEKLALPDDGHVAAPTNQ